MQIPKDKIREVIGTGGKVIREIVAETGAKVDIDDDGVIKISSSDLSQIEAARQWIHGIVAEPEPGTIYTGKVANIVDFGAFATGTTVTAATAAIAAVAARSAVTVATLARFARGTCVGKLFAGFLVDETHRQADLAALVDLE